MMKRSNVFFENLSVFFALHKHWATKWQSRQPVAIFAVTYLLLPHGLKKEPTFSRRSHWFSSKITSAEWAQNPIMNDDVSLPTSGYCFWLDEANLQPLRSTTQICVVTRHQYGIFALVSQTSFRGQTSGVVVKCQLFSQATILSGTKFMLIIRVQRRGTFLEA